MINKQVRIVDHLLLVQTFYNDVETVVYRSECFWETIEIIEKVNEKPN